MRNGMRPRKAGGYSPAQAWPAAGFMIITVVVPYDGDTTSARAFGIARAKDCVRHFATSDE